MEIEWIECAVYAVSSFTHSCKSFEIHYKHPLANHFSGISKLHKFALNAHAPYADTCTSSAKANYEQILLCECYSWNLCQR